MRKSFVFKALAMTLVAASGAAAFAQSFSVGKNGGLEIEAGGVPIVEGESLLLMNSSWKGVCAPTSGKANTGTNSIGVTVSDWSVEGGSLNRELSKQQDGSILVKYQFEFQKGLDGKYIELSLGIPRAAWTPSRVRQDEHAESFKDQPIELQTLGAS
jgi:hypothetical protein